MELHPVGTDIAALRRTLENAGAEEKSTYPSQVLYGYVQNAESIFEFLWGVNINVDNPSSMKIENVSVSRMGTAK